MQCAGCSTVRSVLEGKLSPLGIDCLLFRKSGIRGSKVWRKQGSVRSVCLPWWREGSVPRLFQRNSGLVQKQHVVLYGFQLTVFHSNLQPCGDKRTRLKSRVNGMSSPRTEHPMRAAKHTSCMSEINETHYYYIIITAWVLVLWFWLSFLLIIIASCSQSSMGKRHEQPANMMACKQTPKLVKHIWKRNREWIVRL